MTTAQHSALPAAILWDLDGTLVDTEPIWISAEIDLVTSHGGTWTHDDALGLVGKPLLYSAAIFQERGVDMPAEDIVQWLIARVNAVMLTAGPNWRPGAFELIREAHEAGVPQAIVTMSYREQAEIVVRALPEGAITIVVAGDMVSKGKPDPEAYLTAADHLGVEITECVAVEDSATGVQAAMSAGAHTVAVPYLVPIPEQEGLARVPGLGGLSLEQLSAIAGLAR